MSDAYPWSEIVRGDALQQGDLLWDCPVLRLDQATVEAKTNFTSWRVHAVIMTQSCDLVRRSDGRPKTEYVLLARFFTKEEASKSGAFSKAAKWEEARTGKTPRFHVTNRIKFADGSEDYLLIDLADTFSLDYEFAVRLASSQPRPRLLPPYREHLSQAFARYYMRVGLPSDIPAFK